jgi:hypothetical protein
MSIKKGGRLVAQPPDSLANLTMKKSDGFVVLLFAHFLAPLHALEFIFNVLAVII